MLHCRLIGQCIQGLGSKIGIGIVNFGQGGSKGFGHPPSILPHAVDFGPVACGKDEDLKDARRLQGGLYQPDRTIPVQDGPLSNLDWSCAVVQT